MCQKLYVLRIPSHDDTERLYILDLSRLDLVMDMANLEPPASGMLCTALPFLRDHQNVVVAMDPQVDASIDSYNGCLQAKKKVETEEVSDDGHGNNLIMNVEQQHRPKLEGVDLNESQTDEGLVNGAMDPHRTHTVSTRMQQIPSPQAFSSLPTPAMHHQAPPLTPLIRKTVQLHQFGQLNKQLPRSASLPHQWPHANVAQCVVPQCHTDLAPKLLVEQADEDKLFEHLVTTMTMPDKRSSLRALTQPMVKRLQHHFKRLVPKCPQCKTSRHVSFRYFNNLKKTTILQPRYICKHPLHPTQISKREFALPIRQITGSHCQKLPLDAFRAIWNPLTSPCSSSLQSDVDLGLHLSL